MDFYALPQALYGLEGITQILSHHDNAILHKILKADIVDAQALIVSHSIVYVVNGNVQINTLSGEEVSVQNGEMLFMPRDSYLISDYLRNDADMEVYLLFFDHDIAMEFLGNHAEEVTDSHSICPLKPSENIILFLENIQKMRFDSHHDKALLSLKLLEFLHLVAQEDKERFVGTLQASERHKQKRDIHSLMESHFDKNLTIADFASLSGRSVSTFNRDFKATFSQTPKQWLIQKNMQKAHALLQQGDTVTQVAFEVGYNNISHFIKAYKSIYNQTPKAMQKQHF